MRKTGRAIYWNPWITRTKACDDGVFECFILIQNQFIICWLLRINQINRQKRISFDDKHFRIDLVFYNRFLKCFVIFELKVGELKHEHLGQLQMYVN